MRLSLLSLFFVLLSWTNSATAQNVFLEAGDYDNFAGGTEAATPRPELTAFLGATEDFDGGGAGVFAHSFTGLPDCMANATIRMRLRATSALANTAYLRLGFMEGSDTFFWEAQIAFLHDPVGGGEIFDLVLDLDDLPFQGTDFEGSAMVGLMNVTGNLDIVTTGDLEVDAMTLRYWDQGGPTLTLAGNFPGPVRVVMSCMDPFAATHLVTGPALGAGFIPGGFPCEGTPIDLIFGGLLPTGSANALGQQVIIGTYQPIWLNPGVDFHLQLVTDNGFACETSNVLTF